MPGSSATLQPGHGIGSHTSPGPKRPGEIANLYLKGFEKNLFKKKVQSILNFKLRNKVMKLSTVVVDKIQSF